MFRILSSLCFWILVARWGYAELQLLAPSATPVIDYALQNIQIPTHDKWNTKSLDQFLSDVRSSSTNSLAQLEKNLIDSERADHIVSVVSPELKRVRRVIEEQQFTRF